jgi:hypothetical protein
MTSLEILAAPALMVAYALSDRFVGGGWPKLDAKLPGRSVFWAGLALAGLGWLLGGALLAVLGLLWAAYRSLPFSGATTDWKKALPRHGLFIPAAVFLAVGFHENPLQAGVAFALYTTAAVSLAWAYGRAEQAQRDRALQGLRPERDLAALNGRIELARGLAFGVAATLAFLVNL